ncbi:NIPSNAP family protein [Phyllobacterium sp. SB3]|uniref:NIPSNAP family protein n=1 Tax=Phyllobacterium sp. SB3 TaxID=3156073 RepID=UPI0032AEDD67
MTDASAHPQISRYSPIIELRRYRLHPNKRDELIDIFDTHFLEGQERCGMKIIGQFRDMDDPDAFVWFRGFDNMQARDQALTGFYDGPVWCENRQAANATMIDSDDVLLLHPASRNLDFVLPVIRHAKQKISADTIFQINTYNLKAPAEDGFLDFYEGVIAPILDSAGDNRIALLASDHSENSFTRLPVRLGENVLISVSRFKSAAAQTDFVRGLASSEAFASIQDKLSTWLVAPTVIARLEPTSRSLLR